MDIMTRNDFNHIHMSTPSREIAHRSWEESANDARSSVLDFLSPAERGRLRSVSRRMEMDVERTNNASVASRLAVSVAKQEGIVNQANRELRQALERAQTFDEVTDLLERCVENPIKVTEIVFPILYRQKTRLNARALTALSGLAPGIRVLKLGFVDFDWGPLDNARAVFSRFTNLTHLTVRTPGREFARAVVLQALRASSETIEILEVDVDTQINWLVVPGLQLPRLHTLGIGVKNVNLTTSSLLEALESWPSLRTLRMGTTDLDLLFNLWVDNPLPRAPIESIRVFRYGDPAWSSVPELPRYTNLRRYILETPSITLLDLGGGVRFEGSEAVRAWARGV